MNPNILKLAALVQDDMRDGGKEIVVEGKYSNEELQIYTAWLRGEAAKFFSLCVEICTVALS